MSRKESVLVIGRSSSYCNACRGGADPYEKRHDTELSWSGTREGCGALFVGVSSEYGTMLEEVIKKMRPDLPFMEGIL